ncbi:MAG: hypothetical protein FJ396_07805 [Verrucomicrobia bacterium]|nr:hypothetical protein [Verrucomicrobiota bacterium]
MAPYQGNQEMKTNIHQSLLGLAAGFLAFSAAAQSTPTNDIEPGKETYSVVFAPKPIVLDGNLNEWSGVPVLADPKFAIPKGSGPKGTGKYVLFEEYAGGTWSGPNDQTSAVQIVYDAENVYFGFVVTDDYHENAAKSAWNGDSIQLMIASADRTKQVALYNYALGGVEGDLGETIVMHEAGPGGTEAIVTRNGTSKRTIYEIKLPKASLAIGKLEGGVKFGLGMAINDGDNGAGQAGQKGWGGLGAHAIVFGKTPGETAEITLTKKNDIEPGKEFYTVNRAQGTITIDGKLDEWKGVPVLADPKFSIPKGSGPNGKYVLFEEYAGGTWSGPDDQTSAVQVIFDSENVYFGFVVTDDYHENAAKSAWNGDSIQLMIASADRTKQVALYNYALGGVEGDLGETIVMHEAGPGGTEAVVTRNGATKRTTYEIKLPKASLAIETLQGGVQFGLGMAINDGDAGAGQAGQKGWGGLGAHSIVFGKTPAETALFTLSSVVPNDIEPGKEFYTATAVTAPIVIDGKLTEWGGVPVLSDPKFSVPKGSGAAGTGKYVLFEEYAGGTWSGPDDQTSAVQVVYDADNVYFGFVVTDDYHENAAKSAWNGDSVQLMIASADRQTQVALYNYALGGVDGDLGDVIVMHEAGPGGTEAVVTRDTAKKKTYYEIKLPASAIGKTPPLTLGAQFGLGMAINDGDNGPGQAGQKGWGGLGAHAIVFGKSPKETALVSLGTASTGSDSLFLSAVNPSIITFSFRINDKGGAIADPKGIKLSIDGKDVTVSVAPKSGDATDVTYTAAAPFAEGNHTYLIAVKDTTGKVVTDAGTFISPKTGVLTAVHQAVSVDKTKPGFIWRIVHNEAMTTKSLDDVELALLGTLKDDSGAVIDNFANEGEPGNSLAAGVRDGKTVKFEIATTINLNSVAESSAGAFVPDEGMPGLPGTSGATTGIAAEITTFVELPAGVVTLSLFSDDRVRAQGGPIGKPADGILLGEAGVDLNGANANAPIRFFVKDAGIYPIRVLFQDSGGAAHIEIASVKANGDKVLLNDLENGGFKAYRVGVAPAKSTRVAVGKVPAGLTGTPLTGVSLSEATKTVTADIPTTGTAGYLSISPSVTIISIKNENGKLVITYQ